MKVVAITGTHRAELVDRPDPTPSGEFVVVRIDVTPMCTEYKSWKNGWAHDTLGHEAAGVVVATDGKRKVREGQRVVVMPQYPCGKCRLCLQGDYVYCEQSLNPLEVTGNAAGTATYAQFMLKQDWMLVEIPDTMPIEHASMANCALGPAYGAIQEIGLDGLDTVLITGLGPVGLGAILCAKARGAKVIATESFPFRASLAKELGADHVLDPRDPDVLAQIRSLTDGLGVDRALECAGVPAAQRFCIDALRRRGKMAFVGEAGELTTHVSDDYIRKGITVFGSWYYNLADTAPLIRLISQIGPALDMLITHRFPMTQVEEAFALQERGECGKVLLYPNS